MRSFITLLLIVFYNQGHTLEEFDLDVIKNYMIEENKLSPSTDEWKVNPSKLEGDNFRYKGQAKNRFNWKEIDEDEWLNFDIWKKERARRDSDFAWRRTQRALLNNEVIGKVIKCVGICFNFRGVQKVKSEFQSQLKEGDELATEAGSYAWVFLNDGSLLRLSPETSVTLHEINFSKENIFVMIRLNKGYLNYVPRKTQSHKSIQRPETDLVFSPLMIGKANREFYMINTFRALTKDDRFKFTITPNFGSNEQYQSLNNLIEENNKILKNVKTKYFIYSPSFTIEGSENVVHMFYEPNGVGMFSIQDPVEYAETFDQKVQVVVSRRGYKNTDILSPVLNSWYKVDKDGLEITPETNKLHILKTSIAFLKRTPSIYLARELWVQESLIPMYKSDFSEKEIAETYGYRLWNVSDPNEIQKRLNYIREYTRRVETTNLKSLEKILDKRAVVGFTKKYIKKALVSHYTAVKSLYNKSKTNIFRFTDVQYYLWMIRNGQREN